MKNFLMNEFGKDQGEEIYQQQQEKFCALVKQSTGKSESQLKILKNSILPRIALYQVLQELPLSKELAFKIVEKGFLQDLQEVVKNLHKMEESQCFYKNFCMLFSKDLKGDNWESTIIQCDDKAMIFTMKKCLWHDTCIENDCLELCEMFCQGDNVCYSSMKKITFKRTQTLGMGGKCCDFKFINNES